MRNTPPADEFPPQQPPVTTRGDLAVGLFNEPHPPWPLSQWGSRAAGYPSLPPERSFAAPPPFLPKNRGEKGLGDGDVRP
jgi:hypothetical protein